MNRVEERDMGWQAISREIEAAKGAGVRVGVLGDSQPAEDGTDMVLIAAANEFGTDTIPSRPFMRGAFDERRSSLFNMQRRLWDQVLAGRLTTRSALGLLGETHQGQVQDYMNTPQNFVPNEPSTIRSKTRAGRRGDQPLRDTGRLFQSIRWEHER